MIIQTKKGKANVELKDFITGREFREIQSMFISGAEINDAGAIKAKDPAMFMNIQDKVIDMVLVSVDGAVEGKLEKLLELPHEDYLEVLEQVNEVTKGLNEEKKTN